MGIAKWIVGWFTGPTPEPTEKAKEEPRDDKPQLKLWSNADDNERGGLQLRMWSQEGHDLVGGKYIIIGVETDGQDQHFAFVHSQAQRHHQVLAVAQKTLGNKHYVTERDVLGGGTASFYTNRGEGFVSRTSGDYGEETLELRRELAHILKVKMGGEWHVTHSELHDAEKV